MVRQSVVGHERDAAHVGLGQLWVRRDDGNRGVTRAGLPYIRWCRAIGARCKTLPILVRMPATTLPVMGSMMSPAAFTAAIAPTMSPFGSAMPPSPVPLHGASGYRTCRRWRRPRRRRSFGHAPFEAAFELCSRSPRSAGSSGRRRNRDRTGWRPARSAPRRRPHVPRCGASDISPRPARRQKRRRCRSIARRVHAIDHVQRVEQVGSRVPGRPRA